MGEYIKYKGNEIKIGTCESLYYTSYQKYERALKEGHLSELPGNDPPEEYAKADSGYRFRFPFPDEDNLPFGDIGNFHYHRGVPVRIEPVGEHEQDEAWKAIAGKQMQLEITQQKLVHREKDGKLCLALVVRNPESGLSFRLEEDSYIRKITQDILSNHVLNSSDVQKRSFYRELSLRIEDGFRLEVLASKDRNQSVKKTLPKQKRGRGLR